MIFVSDKITGYSFWGFFENHSIATAVIRDLKNALESGSTTTGHTTKGKYIVAFKLGNKLYIVYHGYYAFLATPDGVWRPRKDLDNIAFPADGVLVLGKEYIDDIPAYTDAKSFCEVIDDNYLQQYCVPFFKKVDQKNTGFFGPLSSEESGQQATLVAGKENIFNTIVYSDYHTVSPFELKNTLIKKAEATAKKTGKQFLNLGRGNPSFLNTTVREAFAHMILFASSQAKQLADACEHR